MRLSINLATRRYVNLRKLDLALLTGFVIFGALAAWCAVELGQNASELSLVRGQLKAIAGRDRGVPVNPGQIKAQASKIAFANQVIERKSVNWLNILDRLEEVVPAGVALTEIAPDKAQLFRVSGVARSFDGVKTLMENMERSQNFTEVYLLGNGETKVGLTQRGVTFNLSCRVALK